MTGRDRLVLRVACVLIACAAVPVLYLRLAEWERDPCVRPADVRTIPAFARADKLKYGDTAEDRGVFDWMSATFETPGASDQPMLARLMRTHDLAPFITEPHQFTRVYELVDDSAKLITQPAGDTEIPIHVRSRESQFDPYIVAWVYLLGGDPVKSPWRSALARAIAHPFSAPEPVTLVVAESFVLPKWVQARQAISTDWLAQVFLELEQVCSP
ncbi:MAG: hypothetical protein JRG92_03620 [Deltaproteobacteria bacterium]|nr:hypothetical protein [Deltaproteobacteria bacterium]MBW2382694.1 hypothetical protein [Deltaproteobacteria bacterium]MBW2697203.1 hypothetical protein [Deltaproteobacteria bacterium]